ncbi:uncharacterized protein PGTG_20703 [Puccinia graminis f. sp. tritici CRL 75-36-700-3]|uniref:Uncharacterized protein n=1 Tax=Puccinia graminis f. sp. tritici (strain CRL 75-36-700-3 / race SCCL) TaxID=418459 RepID=H6QPA5_PUCGT|nr:uncharacterized protein PGTG_20703 [Puccinia graminis f. sp. tritici CRL 75-36-700-3]EHS63610.1 hypothetical protein PGTG_20703 [Puccinia graminis f. sp. tritici CRL 75-36-700-3]
MPSIPSELVAIREGAGIPPDELLELVGRKSAAEGLAGHKDQLAGKGQAGLVPRFSQQAHPLAIYK